jgi:hypothetical protein
MENSKLLQKWKAAAADLGLDIVAPFSLDAGRGIKLEFDFLVKNFGAKNGTIVVTDFASIKPYMQEIDDLGYGFSVLDEPSNKANEAYNRELFIDMLSEWGWAGPEAERPTWVREMTEESQ